MERLDLNTAPTPRTTTRTKRITPKRNSSPPRRSAPASTTKGRHNLRLSRFVFTLNNWTTEEYEALKSNDFKWLCIAKEVAPTTGTRHLQGAAIIGKQLAFSTVQMLPGFSRCWIAMMFGQPQDSLAYCSKQDTNPYIKGELPKPGKRTDIEDTIEALREGHTLSEIAQHTQHATSLVRYPRGLTLLRSLYQRSRKPEDPPKVFWFHGATGTGKTRTAFELSYRCSCFADKAKENIPPPWLSSGSLRWFTGYDGQNVAIFDDLRTKHVEFGDLLRILDRYPYHVQIKGGEYNWTPEYIFVTTPKSPRQMWSLRTEEDIGQLERRICCTLEFPISEEHRSSVFSAVAERSGADFKYTLVLAGIWNKECHSDWGISKPEGDMEEALPGSPSGCRESSPKGDEGAASASSTQSQPEDILQSICLEGPGIRDCGTQDFEGQCDGDDERIRPDEGGGGFFIDDDGGIFGGRGEIDGESLFPWDEGIYDDFGGI